MYGVRRWNQLEGAPCRRSIAKCALTHAQAEEATLKEFFEEYGEVLECKIIVDRATGKSKGYEVLPLG